MNEETTRPLKPLKAQAEEKCEHHWIVFFSLCGRIDQASACFAPSISSSFTCTSVMYFLLPSLSL